MILRGQVDFRARSQSPTAYRRSPSGPGPSVAARHLPTLWGVTLYTRGPLLYTHKLASTHGGPMASIGPYRVSVEGFWPRRGQSEKKQKALRNVQHSCTF